MGGNYGNFPVLKEHNLNNMQQHHHHAVSNYMNNNIHAANNFMVPNYIHPQTVNHTSMVGHQQQISTASSPMNQEMNAIAAQQKQSHAFVPADHENLTDLAETNNFNKFSTNEVESEEQKQQEKEVRSVVDSKPLNDSSSTSSEDSLNLKTKQAVYTTTSKPSSPSLSPSGKFKKTEIKSVSLKQLREKANA